MSDGRLQREQRLLRLRIGRLRRRIDGDLRGVDKQTRRLVCWQTYVTAYPGRAVLAAMGLGLILSSPLRRRRPSHRLGKRLLRMAIQSAGREISRELREIWNLARDAESKEERPSQNGCKKEEGLGDRD